MLGAAGGYVIGPMLNLEGLHMELVIPIISGIVGIVLGASSGLAIAFRDEPRRRQLVTALMVLLPAAALLGGAALGMIALVLVHPLILAVLLPGLALLGRFVATRGDHDHAMT